MLFCGDGAGVVGGAVGAFFAGLLGMQFGARRVEIDGLAGRRLPCLVEPEI